MTTPRVAASTSKRLGVWGLRPQRVQGRARAFLVVPEWPYLCSRNSSLRVLDTGAAGKDGAIAATPEQNAWIGQVLGVTLAGSAEVTGSLVAYRKALLEFEAARKAVDGQIEALRQAVGSKLPAEAKVADELVGHLADMNENVGDLVDAAINAAGEARAAANAKSVAALRAYVAELAGNTLVKHADGNPFVPVSIAETLTGALKKVVATVV